MSEARAIAPGRQPPQRASLTLDLPALITTAVEQRLDPATLQSLLTMYNDQQDRQNREAFNQQMADAAGEIAPVIQDAANKHLGNCYATHGAYMEVLRPILKARAIRVAFELGALAGEQPVPENHVRVRMVIGHGSYAERGSYLDEPVTRAGSQGGRTQMTEQQAVGSALTYAARNLLRMMFNMTPALDEDDDGEGSRETQGSRRAEAKADAATADMVGKSAPVDHEAYKQAFRRRLHLAVDEAAIEALLAIPDIKNWLTAAPLRIKADVEAMIAAKREILAKAAAEAEEKAATTYTPTETLTKLLARVASCETQVALNSFADAPETKDEAAKLSFVESDILMEAVSARLAVLKKEGK